MEYNKNQFKKINDKKVLHKRGKQWIAVSVGLLMALVGATAAAHADATTNASMTILNNSKEQSGANHTNNYTLKSAVPQSANSSQASSTTTSITKQARVLHSQMMINATNKSNANLSNNNTQYRKPFEQSSTMTYVRDGLHQDTEPSENSQATRIPANAPIYKTGSFNSAYEDYVKQNPQLVNTYDELNDQAAHNTNTVNEQSSTIKYGSDNNDPFTGSYTTGIYAGLNYRDYTANNAIEFTDGVMQSTHPYISNDAYCNGWLGMAPTNITTAKSIKFDNNIDTTNITGSDTLGMFFNDKYLQSLDLGNNFNTQNATNMQAMFERDPSLHELILPSTFNTSNVTNMSDMFESDSSLQSLILPSTFNTSNVTSMFYMFAKDTSLQDLTLPKTFNTSNVTNMNSMFAADSSLQNLTLPKTFNTSNVTNMSGMFALDKSLQGLTLPSDFNTSNVTDMSYMFLNNTSLQYLILPSAFNTSNVTNMTGMFFGNISLQNLILPSDFNTDNVTNMTQMFDYDDRSLLKLVIKSPNTIFNSTADVPTLYKQLSDKDLNNNNYTLTASNDFSKGNVGIFVMFPNPKPDTVNYQYNGQTLDTQEIANPENNNGTFNSDINITKSDTELPMGYHLLNTNNPIPFNGGTYNIPLSVNKSTDTITYHDIYGNIDGLTVPSDTTENGSDNESYTISAPVGWAFVNSDGTIASGNNDVNNDSKTFNYNSGNHTLNIAPVYDGLTYKYNKDNQSVEFTGGSLNITSSPYMSDTGNYNLYNTWSVTSPNYIHNAKSIKFDDGINTSKFTGSDAVGMFTGMSNLRTLNLGNSFNTNHITKMDGMFSSDFSLLSLTLPDSFYTDNVSDMADMFVDDERLEKLNLPESFNTHNVIDMYGMFAYTSNLPSLKLPDSFNTNNVIDMDSMFLGDSSLRTLILPKAFNTNKVTQMIGMFCTANDSDNTALQKLVIQSSDTKLIDRSNSRYGTGLNHMYKQLTHTDNAGKHYTLGVVNDFSKGNVGTFVTPPNPKPDTINYLFNGQILKTQPMISTKNADGSFNSTINITSGNATVPNKYHLVSTNDSVPFDGGTYNVQIVPNYNFGRAKAQADAYVAGAPLVDSSKASSVNSTVNVYGLSANADLNSGAIDNQKTQENNWYNQVHSDINSMNSYLSNAKADDAKIANDSISVDDIGANNDLTSVKVAATEATNAANAANQIINSMNDNVKPDIYNFSSANNEANELYSASVNDAPATSIHNTVSGYMNSLNADLNSNSINSENTQDVNDYNQIIGTNSLNSQLSSANHLASSYIANLRTDITQSNAANAIKDLSSAVSANQAASNVADRIIPIMNNMTDNPAPNVYNFASAKTSANGIKPASVNTSIATTNHTAVNGYMSSVNADLNSVAINNENASDNTDYGQMTSLVNKMNAQNNQVKVDVQEVDANASQPTNQKNAAQTIANLQQTGTDIANANATAQQANSYANKVLDNVKPDIYNFASASNEANDIQSASVNEAKVTSIHNVMNGYMNSLNADINSVAIGSENTRDENDYNQITGDNSLNSQLSSVNHLAGSYLADLRTDISRSNASNAIQDLNNASVAHKSAVSYANQIVPIMSNMTDSVVPNVYNFASAKTSADSIKLASASTSTAVTNHATVNDYMSSVNADLNSVDVSNENTSDNANYIQMSNLVNLMNTQNDMVMTDVNEVNEEAAVPDNQQNAAQTIADLKKAGNDIAMANATAQQADNYANKVFDNVKPDVYNFTSASNEASNIKSAVVNSSHASSISGVASGYAVSADNDIDSGLINNQNNKDNSAYDELSNLANNVSSANSLASSYIANFRNDIAQSKASNAIKDLSNAKSANSVAISIDNRIPSYANQISDNIHPVKKPDELVDIIKGEDNDVIADNGLIDSVVTSETSSNSSALNSAKAIIMSALTDESNNVNFITGKVDEANGISDANLVVYNAMSEASKAGSALASAEEYSSMVSISVSASFAEVADSASASISASNAEKNADKYASSYANSQSVSASASASSAYSNASSYANSIKASASTSISQMINSVDRHIASASASASNSARNAEKNADSYASSYTDSQSISASASASSAYSNASSYANSIKASASTSISQMISSVDSHIASTSTNTSNATSSLSTSASKDSSALNSKINSASTNASSSVNSLSESASATESTNSSKATSLASYDAKSLSVSVSSASLAITSTVTSANSYADSLSKSLDSSASTATNKATSSMISVLDNSLSSLNNSLASETLSASSNASNAYSSAVSYADYKYTTESGVRSSVITSLYASYASIVSASFRELSHADSAYNAESSSVSKSVSAALSSAERSINSASISATKSVASALSLVTSSASKAITSLSNKVKTKVNTDSSALNHQITSASTVASNSVASLSSSTNVMGVTMSTNGVDALTNSPSTTNLAINSVNSVAESQSNNTSETASNASQLMGSVAQRHTLPISKIVHHKASSKASVYLVKDGKITKVNIPMYIRWLYVKNTCLAHKHLTYVGHIKDYYERLHHGFEAKIQKIFIIKYHDHNYLRYQIKLGKHVAYVTGNSRFVKNAYLMKKDLHHAWQFGLNHHRYYEARVVKKCAIYKSFMYNRRTKLATINPGKLVQIKRIIHIGKKNALQTRFQLTNGEFITANRKFIKLI